MRAHDSNAATGLERDGSVRIQLDHAERDADIHEAIEAVDAFVDASRDLLDRERLFSQHASPDGNQNRQCERCAADQLWPR